MKIIKYLAPLNCISVALIVFGIVVIAKHNPNDVEGWDVVAAIGMLFYAFVIIVISAITTFIKDLRIWLIVQLLLSVVAVIMLIL